MTSMTSNDESTADKETTKDVAERDKAISPTIDDSNDSEICPCGEELPDETKLVCCDSCQQWWHGACANLKGITEEGIAELQDWKCPYCFVSPYTPPKLLKTTFPSLFGMDIDKPIETAVKAEVRKVIPKIIKAVIQETVKEKNFSKTFADAVKERHEEFSVQANRTIEKSMNSAIQNNQQRIMEKASVKQDADNIAREKRKRNVVFSSVPESKLKSADARQSSDMKKIQKIVEPEEDNLIVSCHRAGKLIGDRPRLLIVTMATPDLAQSLHCYGSGQKFETTNGTEIWCNPDLIKADRIANFQARKLQRARREKSGKDNENSGEQVAATGDDGALQAINVPEVNSVLPKKSKKTARDNSSPTAHGPF